MASANRFGPCNKVVRGMSMAEPHTISEFEATAMRIPAEGYELRLWRNGIYFIEAPSGEGTSVPEEAVAGALAKLFKTFF